jgi:hypothetical protein
MGERKIRLPLSGVRLAQVGEHVSRAAHDCAILVVGRFSLVIVHGGPRNPVARP